MTHRVFLVGESNPYGSYPEFALWPQPPNAAGGRLARVLGMTDDEYLAAFERRNLVEEGIRSVHAWRVAADDLLRETEHSDRLVLLGAKVSAAFSVEFRRNLCLVRWSQVGTDVLRGRWVLVVPHPSGRSREWNDPEMRRRVRAAVGRLRRPEPEEDPAGGAEIPQAGLALRPDRPEPAEPTRISDLSDGDRGEVDRFTRWLAARGRWTAGELSPDEFAAAERELYPNGLGGA